MNTEFGIELNSKVLPVFMSVFFNVFTILCLSQRFLVEVHCFGFTNVDQLVYEIDLTIVNSPTLVSVVK